MRYSDCCLPFDFIKNNFSFTDDELQNFILLSDKLQELGSYYGALPAHDGLWQAVEATIDEITGRLETAPLMLEAHGLNVTSILI